MRHLRALVLLGVVLTSTAPTTPPIASPDVLVNPNIARAGVLRDGVLALAIEAALGTWHADGDRLPGTLYTRVPIVVR